MNSELVEKIRNLEWPRDRDFILDYQARTLFYGSAGDAAATMAKLYLFDPKIETKYTQQMCARFGQMQNKLEDEFRRMALYNDYESFLKYYSALELQRGENGYFTFRLVTGDWKDYVGEPRLNP